MGVHRSSPNDEVRQALAASHLRSLPGELVARIVDDASRLHVAAGSTIHSEGDTSPHLEIVVTGLVRVCVTAPDGRTMTVRYCRPGALLGAVSLFASPFSLPVTIQAVTDADLVAFRPSLVQRLAERDPRLARALLDELSDRALSFMAEIAGTALPPYTSASLGISSTLRQSGGPAPSWWPKSASRSSPMQLAACARSSFECCGGSVRQAS